MQDQDDEALLVQAARTVFDLPRDPPTHVSEFLARGVERVGRGPGTDSSQAALTGNEIPG